MSLKSLNNIFKGDKVIWMVFFLLCMISIVEVYSASSTLSYKGGNYWAPLLKHGGMLFIGFIVMIVVMNIKCRYFKIATLPALVLSVLMLIGVLLTGGVTNGASRWIEVMGIQFQPSRWYWQLHRYSVPCKPKLEPPKRLSNIYCFYRQPSSFPLVSRTFPQHCWQV